jgi:hypothetical protein
MREVGWCLSIHMFFAVVVLSWSKSDHSFRSYSNFTGANTGPHRTLYHVHCHQWNLHRFGLMDQYWMSFWFCFIGFLNLLFIYILISYFMSLINILSFWFTCIPLHLFNDSQPTFNLHTIMLWVLRTQKDKSRGVRSWQDSTRCPMPATLPWKN